MNTLPPISGKPWGPDLSSHNAYPSQPNDPDFHKIAAAGASFVIIKKSQGTSYSFAKYGTFCQQAKAAGLIVFDYHYLSYDSLPADQVPMYLEGRKTAAKPIFDFENWSDGGSQKRRGEDYMQAWGHDLALQLHTATGEYPIVYTYPYFYVQVLADPMGEPWPECPLWIADYSNHSKNVKAPVSIGPFPYHTFWQYTSVGHLDGVDGVVDLSVFNGSIDRLKVLAHAA